MNLPGSLTALHTESDLNNDGRRDLTVIFQRRIMIFFQKAEGTFPPAPDIEIGAAFPLPASYAAVGVGSILVDYGSQLLFVHPNGMDYLSVQDLLAGVDMTIAPRPLLEHAISITPGPALHFLSLVADYSGDGRPEIMVPSGDELLIFAEGTGGKFVRTGAVDLTLRTSQITSLESEPPILGSRLFDEISNFDNLRLLPRSDRWHAVQYAVRLYNEPVILTDITADKRIDVIGPGSVSVQSESGEFATAKTDLYQRIHRVVVPHETQNLLITSPNLVDFNGDGIIDSYKVEGSAAKLGPRTDVSVYLGGANHILPTEPTQVLRTRDFAYSDALPIGDLNNDGKLDIGLFHLDFQPSSAQSQMRSYLKKGVEGQLRFYLWDSEKNQFDTSHAFDHPVLVNYEIYGARQLFRQQVVMNRDMTGDAFPDLVLKTGPMEISVYENEQGKGFSRTPKMVINTAPTRFSSFSCSDLNNDGRADVIIHGYVEGQDQRNIYSFFLSREAD